MPGASERSEQPTQRKLREARKKGQIPVSRDLASAASFGAAAVAVFLSFPHMVAVLRGLIVASIRSSLPAPRFERADAIALFDEAGWAILDLVAPALLSALVAGTLATILQTGGSFSAAGLTPKMERFNPIAGIRRLVQMRTFSELGKTWAKLGAVGLAVASSIATYRGDIAGWLARGGEPSIAFVAPVARAAVVRSALTLLALGACDVLIQRRLHQRELRMTKDEVKRDHKDEEGDPHIKHARRETHREIASSAFAGAIRTSSFVAVNPTYLAVAVHYDDSKAEAPRVVAKGAGALAKRIREVAESAGVRIVRDKPLARELFRVTVDEEIPEALYVAVAEILVYIAETASDVEGTESPNRRTRV